MADEEWGPSSDVLKDYADPGTPPGTLRPALGETGPSRIIVTTYTAEGAVVAEAPPDDPSLVNRPDGGTILWVHVVGLGDVSVVERLGATFGLHPLALEDVLTLGQRPKAEEYDETVFCIAQYVAFRSGEVDKTQIAAFLGDGFLVSFQPAGEDVLAPVRERLLRGRGRLRQKGACHLLYAVLDLAVDSAFPTLEAVGAHLDEIEESILDRPEHDDVEALQATRRELLLLRQTLWPQREMVGRLAREEHDLMPDDVRIYFRDCYDHAVQALEVSENFRETASGLLDIYLSSLSHRLNEVMRILTIISTIFMPLGFLAGVYGMNFDRSMPWNMPELGWKYGYLGFWGVAVALVVSMLALFRKKGWL